MYRAAVNVEYDIVPVQSVLMDHYFVFSHFWFAIPQEVLHADWQDVWHSPQPSLRTLSFMFFVLIVLILFIVLSLLVETSIILYLPGPSRKTISL